MGIVLAAIVAPLIGAAIIGVLLYAESRGRHPNLAFVKIAVAFLFMPLGIVLGALFAQAWAELLPVAEAQLTPLCAAVGGLLMWLFVLTFEMADFDLDEVDGQV